MRKSQADRIRFVKGRTPFSATPFSVVKTDDYGDGEPIIIADFATEAEQKACLLGLEVARGYFAPGKV